MATRPLSSYRNAHGVRRNSRARASKPRVENYQLNVVTADVPDLVQSVGGWLVDRTLAGWEVNVLVTDLRGVLPLQVLGARPVGLEAGLISLIRRRNRAAGLAVAANLLTKHENLHWDVRSIVRSGLTEVALWGGAWPASLAGPADSVDYRISAAARHFKSHALAAAGITDVAVATTERLVRGGYRSPNSYLFPIR
jgi:hypothetical protein